MKPQTLELSRSQLDLHARLIALQSDDELERKWRKAQGRWSNRYWSQEWIDVADRRGTRLWEGLFAEPECTQTANKR